MNRKYIFTFWEPTNNIPDYVQLCIDTWKYNLPGYEIVILDYSNLSNWLSKKQIKRILCKDMTLPIQADAIRVALLRKYGGIWLDADTIILHNKFLKRISDYDLAMIGDTQKQTQHIAFIYAKTCSDIIEKWYKKICKRVFLFRLFNKCKILRNIFRHTNTVLHNWDVLGNGILDDLVNKSTDASAFLRLDKMKLGSLPEYTIATPDKAPNILYNEFWFGHNNKTFDDVKNICFGGIILLHNSWTPDKYKQMTKNEFLDSNILLARVLKNLYKVNPDD